MLDILYTLFMLTKYCHGKNHAFYLAPVRKIIYIYIYTFIISKLNHFHSRYPNVYLRLERTITWNYSNSHFIILLTFVYC